VAIVVPRYRWRWFARGSGRTVRPERSCRRTVVRFSGSLGVSFSPDVASTTAGAVSVTAFPGRESGFAQLDAATGSGAGRATVWVRPGPARNVRLGYAPPQAEPGSRVHLVATLTDGYGNPAEGDAPSGRGGDPSADAIVRGDGQLNTVTAGAGRELPGGEDGSSSAQAVIDRGAHPPSLRPGPAQRPVAAPTSL
jgi:hypothetical protein